MDVAGGSRELDKNWVQIITGITAPSGCARGKDDAYAPKESNMVYTWIRSFAYARFLYRTRPSSSCEC